MSGDFLHQLIQRELDELDKMMCRYAEAIRLGSAIEPELLQVTALGSVLHSFYSGIERIFAEVAKRIDRSLPQGDRWHTELLIQIARPTASRPAVISDATQRQLRRYLAFRHYYRHSYSHLLAWSRLQELIADLTDFWHLALIPREVLPTQPVTDSSRASLKRPPESSEDVSTCAGLPGRYNWR